MIRKLLLNAVFHAPTRSTVHAETLATMEAIETHEGTGRSEGVSVTTFGTHVGDSSEPADTIRYDVAAMYQDRWDHRPPICPNHWPNPCGCYPSHLHAGDTRVCWCEPKTPDAASATSTSVMVGPDGRSPHLPSGAPTGYTYLPRMPTQTQLEDILVRVFERHDGVTARGDMWRCLCGIEFREFSAHARHIAGNQAVAITNAIQATHQ